MMTRKTKPLLSPEDFQLVTDALWNAYTLMGMFSDGNKKLLVEHPASKAFYLQVISENQAKQKQYLKLRTKLVKAGCVG